MIPVSREFIGMKLLHENDNTNAYVMTKSERDFAMMILPLREPKIHLIFHEMKQMMCKLT